jgi:hypothetical protein
VRIPVVLSVVLPACTLGFLVGAPALVAQAPAPPSPAGDRQVHGSLAQVMQGILFPASNVIFFVQTSNPAEVKRADDPSMSTDALTGVYGGWQAVENGGIALAEAANLLMIPGRVCSNGKPVPLSDPEWAGFVQGLREAGMVARKAAAGKDQEAFLDVSDTMATACANCHDVYREKSAAQGGPAARCTK